MSLTSTRVANDLDTSHRLQVRIDGPEYAAQKIRQRLMFIRGEWFLDSRKGMPWFEEILVKNPDLRQVQARVRDCILSVPGITKCDIVEAKFDPITRNLTLAYRAMYGDAIVEDEITSPVI